jgi:hypothetical protein
VRPALALAVALASVSACTGANGGAVELSWRLRPAEGPIATTTPFLSCDLSAAGSGIGPVARIQLGWTVASASGSSDGVASWDCNATDGTTGFDLAPGDALLTVSPVCDGGSAADPASYTAPAPIERTVVAGDAIDLGAVELVLQVSSCGAQPCTCTSPTP